MPWLLVGLFRFLVSLLVWWWPLAGSVAGILADNFDVVLLDVLGITDFGFYNTFDKGFDSFLYLIQALTMARWHNGAARKVGWGLFLYRLMGVVIFSLFEWRPLLLIFPNLFELYFVVYLVIIKFGKYDPMASRKRAVIFLTLLLIPKLYQECLWHVVQIPLYQFFRPIVFFWQ